MVHKTLLITGGITSIASVIVFVVGFVVPCLCFIGCGGLVIGPILLLLGLVMDERPTGQYPVGGFVQQPYHGGPPMVTGPPAMHGGQMMGNPFSGPSQFQPGSPPPGQQPPGPPQGSLPPQESSMPHRPFRPLGEGLDEKDDFH